MTDFVGSVRPTEPLSDSEVAALTGVPTPDGEPSVRQLLTELAELEDTLRLTGPVSAPSDEAAWATRLAVVEREQAIIDELHRRMP